MTLDSLSPHIRRIWARHDPRRAHHAPTAPTTPPTAPTRPPAEANAPLCATCRGLDVVSMLRRTVWNANKLPLGTVGRVLSCSASCGLCRLIATVVRRSWQLPDDDDGVPDADVAAVELFICSEPAGWRTVEERAVPAACAHRLRILSGPRPFAVLEAQRAAAAYLSLELQVLGKDAGVLGREAAFHGRRMEDAVDVALLQSWVRCCETTHGGDCADVWWREPGEEKRLAVLRVIDVKRMAIVRAPRGCRYVALSYVWGDLRGVADYRTVKANVRARGKAGGLDAGCLPATIADALSLAKALGERYVWVDALCIVQDDDGDKAAQIGIMDAVYSGAVFTVVAAGGRGAADPLPGVRPASRRVVQRIEMVDGVHVAVPLPTFGEAVARTTWNTRAWTYQERLLSRRRLVFTPHQAYFHCRRDVWSEDVASENGHARAVYPGKFSAGGGTFPDHPRPRPALVDAYFKSVIDEYSRLNMTEAGDVLNAVGAIATVLAKGYADTDFAFGVPVAKVEGALLWLPTADVPLVRRTAVVGGVKLPSWSWAGWCGPIRYGDLMVYTGGSRDPAQSFVRAWHLAGASGRLEKLPTKPASEFNPDPDAPEKPDRYKGVWSAEPAAVEHMAAAPGTLVFRTTAARFVVHVRDVGERTGSQRPYIEQFRAESACQRIWAILSGSTLVGAIVLPRPDDVDQERERDFVVLSRNGRMPTGIHDEGVFGPTYYGCFLNVMAVERRGDGSMRRLGVGLIFEAAWTQADLKELLVFLR